MIFSLAIYAPPTSESSLSALRFAQAAIANEHSIFRVFFYSEGVYNGSSLTEIPQDEFNVLKAWLELKAKSNCELCVCIAASVKRGIFTQTEAERYDRHTESLLEDFNLVGLGDLVEASTQADRTICFGAV